MAISGPRATKTLARPAWHSRRAMHTRERDRDGSRCRLSGLTIMPSSGTVLNRTKAFTSPPCWPPFGRRAADRGMLALYRRAVHRLCKLEASGVRRTNLPAQKRDRLSEGAQYHRTARQRRARPVHHEHLAGFLPPRPIGYRRLKRAANAEARACTRRGGTRRARYGSLRACSQFLGRGLGPKWPRLD